MTKAEREQLFDYKIQVVEEKISALDSKLEKNNAAMDSKMNRILQKLDEQDGKYVTKHEHENNEKRIEKLEGKVESFNIKVATWAGAISVIAFIIAKLWK